MSGAARPVYRHADLDRVLNPASIAIVGASARPGSFGERLHNNLQGFAGSVFPEVVCRLSQLAADQRERISELDVNPLICAGSRVVAVDALIARRTS
jgi:hypothetical protein